MEEPILLYSTITWLAYRIGNIYYGGRHFVWCSQYLDRRDAPNHFGILPPPTSSPFDIYYNLLEEVRSGDRHSTKVTENKAGILRGVEYQFRSGRINEEQAAEIRAIVEYAQVAEFRLLVLIIPYHFVQDMVEIVPIRERAYPAWVEYRIIALPAGNFHVVHLAR